MTSRPKRLCCWSRCVMTLSAVVIIEILYQLSIVPPLETIENVSLENDNQFLNSFKKQDIQNITKPSQASIKKSTRPHQALDRRCYHYSLNVTARNTCCQLYNYRQDLDIMRCIAVAYEQKYPGHKNVTELSENTSQDPLKYWMSLQKIRKRNNGSIYDTGVRGGVHWALVGDSHVRYILDVILRRLASSGLEYTQRRILKGEWKAVHVFLNRNRLRGTADDIEVRHLVMPLYITWYSDTHLTRVSSLIHQWETGRQLRPSLLVLNSGLHAIVESDKNKEDPQIQRENFKKNLETVAPDLARFSAHNHTTVVFKMLDSLQMTDENPFSREASSKTNFQAYNRAVHDSLSGTGVVLWDSTVPLSRAYQKQCWERDQTTRVSFFWKCVDTMHVGYIAVEQYVEMLLNDVCNKYMSLTQDFCS